MFIGFPHRSNFLILLEIAFRIIIFVIEVIELKAQTRSDQLSVHATNYDSKR